MIQKQYYVGENILLYIEEIIEESLKESALFERKQPNHDPDLMAVKKAKEKLDKIGYHEDTGIVLAIEALTFANLKIPKPINRNILIKTGVAGKQNFNYYILRQLPCLTNKGISSYEDVVTKFSLNEFVTITIEEEQSFTPRFPGRDQVKIHNPFIGDYPRSSYDFTIIETGLGLGENKAENIGMLTCMGKIR